MTEKHKAAERRKRTTVLHAGFEIGILLKGVHAALEIVGGLLLWFVSPESLSKIVRLLTQNELAEDPRDLIANIMIKASEHYSLSTQHFGVLYLLSHGGIKVVLVLLLWRKKPWAYPLAVAALVLFIIYQTIRWTTTHSAFLAAFTMLDAIMIWLTIVEYRRIKDASLSRERSHRE
jgi:uncharacterized membrane protein